MKSNLLPEVHRILQKFAKEFGIVIWHARVHWLARGKVLHCFGLSEDAVFQFLEICNEIS